MALRTVPTTVLLLAAAALVLAAPCCSGADGTGCSFFPGASLIGCAAPPAAPPGTPSVADDDGTTFRAALAPLLAALPSAAAATGFASLRSAGDDAGARAFGLCFGEPDDHCLVCLASAAAAVAEGCGNGTCRAGVWREGCLLAYADDDWRDEVLAEPKGQSPGKSALSVLFYALAAVGAVAIVLLLCGFIAAFMIAQTLVRHSAAAGHAAAAGQGGEGITAYLVASNGRSPLWSLAVQMRFY